jgi:hypothetical protein
LHLVFGSGGSKAILGGAGAILAFEVAGLRNWVSIGSASGGSFPASFLASGKPTKDIVRAVVDADFAKLLRPRTGFLRQILALLLKYRYEATRPERGVFSSAPLARFVDEEVPTWPSRFWTVASGRCALYVFTDKGVIVERRDGARKLVQDSVRPSFAVAATCAVPGFIDAVRYRNDLLHDGALGRDGECPAGVAVRHFGAERSKVVAFDIAEEAIKSKRWLRLLWQIGCMGACPSFAGMHLRADDGYVLIQPHITGFHGLQFKLTKELKWNAVITGFSATVETLLREGLVPVANLDAVTKLEHAINETRTFAEGAEFVREIEELLTQRDLLSAAKEGT